MYSLILLKSNLYQFKIFQIIIAAVEDRREDVLEQSRTMGFLTGYETKQMEDAHVNAVMILGELFRTEGEFDFSNQVRQ